MQIRKVDHNVFDIFQGKGFDEWSRVRRYHWGYKVVNGLRLDREQLNVVSTKLERHPAGGIENV